MASASSSHERRCTTCFTEEGVEILRSKRSSVIIDCSDGSKMIFVRGPHPRLGSSWVSPSKPSSPPPPSASSSAQGPGSGPNAQPSGTPRPRRKDSNQSESGSASRTCGGQGTPGSGYGDTETPSHDYSHRTSPARPSTRHGKTGTSPRRTSTRKPAENGLSSPSECVPSIFPP
ncbi:hypothetical protein F5X98DRAFT_310876 [Xylaria grammica]|nr:hypothetical protein F5X98DRAFT_310876 [Xylaria grammica]